MRYILLASLAASDILCLILTNSFRIASIAEEKWRYGQTMCYLNPFFVRYFYFNTVLHLIAVSYERYKAIVRSPLTHDGTMTKCKSVFIALIWIVPILVSIGPFLGFGNYVYNPEVFFCEQGWSVHDDSIARNIALYVIGMFLVPFLVIVFLNWRVLKTANILKRNAAAPILNERTVGAEIHRKETLRRMNERKAAVDVSVIIAAFLLCFLPGWIVGLCRQFVKNVKIPAEVTLSTTCIFFVSSVCNPIIYSIRKREFRTRVKNLFRRVGVAPHVSPNEISCQVESASLPLRRQSNAFFLKTRRGPLPSFSGCQQGSDQFLSIEAGVMSQRPCLSPIPEMDTDSELHFSEIPIDYQLRNCESEVLPSQIHSLHLGRVGFTKENTLTFL